MCILVMPPLNTVHYISLLGTQTSSLTKTRLNNQYAQDVLPPPPEPVGRPEHRRSGGASRSGCAAIKPGQLPLFALIQEKGQIFTTSGYPTLWFYIPYSTAAIDRVELEIHDVQDDQGTAPQSLYPEKVVIPPGMLPGVIGIRLPTTSNPLQVGKTYRWTLEVYCGGQSANGEPAYVQGTFQRITPTLKLQQQLKAQQHNPREQMLLYARNGFWYEALTTLAELRRDRPRDPKLLADWQKLLQSIGLQDVSNKPLLPCCTLSR